MDIYYHGFTPVNQLPRKISKSRKKVAVVAAGLASIALLFMLRK